MTETFCGQDCRLPRGAAVCDVRAIDWARIAVADRSPWESNP